MDFRKDTTRIPNPGNTIVNNSLGCTIRLVLMSLLLTAPGSLPAVAQRYWAPNAQLASKEVNDRVEALLKKMTLDEKIGQLVVYSDGIATGLNASNFTYEELVAKGQMGSMVNVVGAEKTNHYQHIAMKIRAFTSPCCSVWPSLHGDHTVFPIPLAIAASWDPGRPKLSHVRGTWKLAPTALTGCSRPW